MKTFGLILLSTLLFFGNSKAQNKQLTNEVSQEVVPISLGELVKSKNFEFAANTAMPLGKSSINLVGNEYTVVFSADKIVSDLPYYGVATRSAGLDRKSTRLNSSHVRISYAVFCLKKKKKKKQLNTSSKLK